MRSEYNKYFGKLHELCLIINSVISNLILIILMTESAMCLYYISLLHSLFACSGSKYKIHFTQILLYSTNTII